ncbi:MAG: FAD-dependent oxidoreductase [Ruminococcaceae bacterium]|nr:FAD-dependent oxidoreductase [Oscillospiraceae bacterium]
MTVFEKIETPVTEECDCLVCGGGFAGISAAIAATRLGKKVILLEKTYMLGGLGTAGLIAVYLPLCDGVGHQVSFGIAEELFRLSVSMGHEDNICDGGNPVAYPDNWLDSDDPLKRTEADKRFEVQYNPQLFAIFAEQLLINSGVKILYGTYAVAVDKTDDRINAVVIESKSGREAIKAKTFVDATGDCDIACFAGAETKKFKQGNTLASWYYFVGQYGYALNTLGFADIPEDQKTEQNRVQLLNDRRFSGLTKEDLSEFSFMSHASMMNDILRRRKADAGVMPVTIPTLPEVRMTRKIVGEYTLDDKEEHKYFEDSIGMVSNWRKRGPIFEVPFRTLYSNNVKNLIVAGRCTSVTDSMWDIMRTIPCCAVTGEAAGVAAAISDDFSTLDVKRVQEILKNNGVKLHESEII